MILKYLVEDALEHKMNTTYIGQNQEYNRQ